MNIFANLKQYKSQQEIILLFNESFCDYQLIRDTIRTFNYEKEDITFILHTGLLTDSQEKFLNSFLQTELSDKYKHITYKPSDHYILNGQKCATVYHHHLRCYVFTSDPTEKDIEHLNNSAKKIVGWTIVERRLTEDEIIKQHKIAKKNAIKEKFSSIGSFLITIVFLGLIVFSSIYINDHKEVVVILAAIISIGFGLFLFFAVYYLFQKKLLKSSSKKWPSIFKSIGITIGIIAILFIIFHMVSNSGSHFINDAHRPDRF